VRSGENEGSECLGVDECGVKELCGEHNQCEHEG
jgi:hypothetical protein